MTLTHAVAKYVLLRASRVDQIPQFDSASNSAVKLLRAFAMQVEALATLQCGGEQVVHVPPGAQAIVGNVVQQNARDGGGVIDDNSNQPHVPERMLIATRCMSTQPSTALPCKDEGRQTVPSASRQG